MLRLPLLFLASLALASAEVASTGALAGVNETTTAPPPTPPPSLPSPSRRPARMRLSTVRSMLSMLSMLSTPRR